MLADRGDMHEALKTLVEDLRSSFDAEHSEFRGQHKLLVPAEKIVEICQKLKDEHGVEKLYGVTAVDS